MIKLSNWMIVKLNDVSDEEFAERKFISAK